VRTGLILGKVKGINPKRSIKNSPLFYNEVRNHHSSISSFDPLFCPFHPGLGSKDE
jgi:hypothetical protein